MVSYLTTNLDIDGDYKGNIVFTPNMTDRTISATKIFFPPMFKLSNSLIREAIEDIRDLKEAFVSQVMYMKLSKYATDPANGYKKISIQDADKSGIISDNMKYLLNLWISKNGNIMINNRVYNIVTVRFIKQGDVIGQPTNYSLNAKVRVIQKERDGMIARQRMTCDDKREHINELYNKLFEDILFSRSSSTIDERLAPTMMTNNYGQTTGRTQITPPTAINQYPFAPPRGMYGTPIAMPMAFAVPVRGGKKAKKNRRRKSSKKKSRGKKKAHTRRRRRKGSKRTRRQR